MVVHKTNAGARHQSFTHTQNPCITSVCNGTSVADVLPLPIRGEGFLCVKCVVWFDYQQSGTVWLLYDVLALLADVLLVVFYDFQCRVKLHKEKNNML